MQVPVFLPGFEDSTAGNIFAARVIDGTIKRHEVVLAGTVQMEHLVRWYVEQARQQPIGFFQIGGGIAGDFAVCAVPLILQDLKDDVPLWSYFAQISDSTTSYGIVFRRSAERKDHLVQTRQRSAQVRHQFRRVDRRAADFCLRVGAVEGDIRIEEKSRRVDKLES